MKITELVMRHVMQSRLKARLLKDITLEDGTVFLTGQESNLLIDRGDGTYHFEANNSACQVIKDEIEFFNPMNEKQSSLKKPQEVNKNRFNIK